MREELLQTWAGQEMGGAIVKDERQRKNLIRMCLRLQQAPNLSFSAACGASVRKSASRLFSQQDIDLQQGHIEQTVGRCQGQDLILIAEDTTDLNYDDHPQTQGLGHLGGPSNVLGLAIHSGLALSTQGEPLGLIGQHIWAPISTNYRDGGYLRKLPIEEKESYKWLRTLKWTKEHFQDFDGQLLLIGDREGDFWEHFTAERPGNTQLLVRALHVSRRVLVAGKKMQLQQAAPDFPKVGSLEVAVCRKPGQAERLAHIDVHIGHMVCPPANNRTTGKSVPMSVIWAKETAPPTDVEPLEWYLLTTGQINTFEQAREMIRFYTLRWTIERFHYVLKQGLKVERLQFDTFQRLANALRVCSVVAWYLLRLAYLVKVKPEEPAHLHFDQHDTMLLTTITQHSIYSVKDFIIALGKLVGFSPSKKQPFPGEKLLWQATQILFNIRTGFLIQQNYGTG